MVYRLHEKDLSKLYNLKIHNGKSHSEARYEVEQMRRLIKRYGKTTRGREFKYSKDIFLDYDEDGIINAFDCQPLNFWRQGDEHFYDHKDFSSSFTFVTNPEKYRVTTKYMTADEFLALAKRATINFGADNEKSNEEYSNEVLRQEKIKEYAAALKKGDKFPTPFLGFRQGSKNPYRHEGRHRAAAIKLAYGKKKKFPVYIVEDTEAF